MKKLILSLILISCVSCNSYALTLSAGNIDVSGTSAGTGCPIGEYFFWWNGLYNIGGADTDKACLNSGGEAIDGVNTGGVFGTDGPATTWTANANNDRLVWTIDSGDIDADAAGGITIYQRIRGACSVGNNPISEFIGDNNNLVSMQLNTSGTITTNYFYNSTYPNKASDGKFVTCDSVTWNVVGSSWKVGEPANDLAAYAEGTWVEGDLDIGSWVQPEISIMLGDFKRTGTIDSVSTKEFVILPGYKAVNPWL